MTNAAPLVLSRWLASAVACSLVACANPYTDSGPDGGDAASTDSGDGGAATTDATAGDASGDATDDDAGDSGAQDASPDGSAPVLPNGTPATVLLDGARLASVQSDLAGGASGSPAQRAALANLVAAANAALVAGTWSVTSKAAQYVANGDPHEYASWGPYWWPPDAVPPATPGTLGTCPYVNHDGIRNPNVDRITDRHGLHATSEAIFELALAWYFTGNPAYADQAERVARTWFLDPQTAMKPDMAYAQQHGPCGVGNAAGLIEASGGYLTDALDGLAILALDSRPNGWTAADRAGLQSWMTQFLAWLVASPIGIGEQAALNNHGTWYDAFVSSIDLFLGDVEGAKAVATNAKSVRIDKQIMADGSMPQELSRTTSWHYSNYNIAGLCRLAGVAGHVGVDLWGYHSASGGSIAKAIDFILPTATSSQPPGSWAQYKDITVPFDQVYQAESYYSIHAAADFGHDALAMAVITASPNPVQVPGHYCSGERFPTGSDFCGMTPGSAAFVDLQATGTPAVDMWPVIPTCRVPVN